MKTLHLDCTCSSLEHAIRFSYYEDEPIVYVHFFLEQPGFLKRLYLGIKYILGHRSKFGEFGETLFDKEQIEKLEKFLKVATQN
jgi:hypothetical protein